MTENNLRDFLKTVSDSLNDKVFAQIYSVLQRNPQIRKNLNPAFPFPTNVRVGILDTCLAVEYVGPNNENENSFTSQIVYQPDWNVYDFIGLDIKHLRTQILEINTSIENTSTFLGNSIGLLTNYFYDLTQQPSELLQMFSMMGFSKPTKPICVSNSNYFWTDQEEKLKVKRIDFLELFPYNENQDIMFHDDASLDNLVRYLLNPIPTYKVDLHGKLNVFIELLNQANVSEPIITKFLSLNPEILQMAFGVNELNAQVELEWQSRTQYDNLKPDFLPIRMDGYADILEFKLPWLKNSPSVGTAERRHPSFEIDSAIAQIDLYEIWCSQINNIQWLEEKRGIKLNNPDRILVIGHSSEYSSDDRAKLRKIRNTKVFTYDEFIEMARVQLYRYR